MKQSTLIFIIIFFLVSCGPSQNLSLPPEATAPVSDAPIQTALISATATVTIPPSLTPSTPTLTPVLCDPRLEDYCITDGHLILQRPIHPPEDDSVDGTYRYASTAHGTRDPHHGVEIGKDFGAPVYAVADGVVLFAGPDKVAVYSPWTNFYGNVIVIRHPGDLFTLYGHLSELVVSAGAAVQVGEKIGEVGQSGAATGSHLHFEVRQGDVQDYFSAVNPELWLIPALPDSGVVSLAIRDEASQLQSTTLTLQHYADSNQIIAAYYLETYDPHMPMQEENAVIGDLPAGRYRITLIYKGYLYERWVEVQSGKLTQAVIVVK